MDKFQLAEAFKNKHPWMDTAPKKKLIAPWYAPENFERLKMAFDRPNNDLLENLIRGPKGQF